MNITVFLLLAVFALFVILMITNKMPALVALPVMGIVVAIVGGVPFADMSTIIEDGALLLRSAYVPMMFAGIFGDVIKKTGIAENLIRRSVELAGDNSLVVALVCLAVTSLCFMGLTGTGSVVMVGMIVLPILLSVGVPKVVAAGILLFGNYIGYAFNAGRWSFFTGLFTVDGQALIELQDVGAVTWKFAIPAIIIAIAFVVIGVVKKPKMLSWATKATNNDDYEKVPMIALLAPIVPLLCIVGLKMKSACLAFMVGILFAILTTQYKTKFKGVFKTITSAAHDGFQSIAMTTVLMFGVGILVVACQRPELSEPMATIINAITPKSVIGFILVFGVVGSLLTQYRGPMSPWGLGTALLKILSTTSGLNLSLLLITAIGYDYIVGVTDATSSQVVWAAGAVESSPTKVQIGTIPFTWLTALIGVIMGVCMFPLFG